VNHHHHCWAVDLKEAPAAVGVAPEAVTLSLPEQNLIQILSLSATAVVPGVQEVVQAAALPLVVVQADPGAVPAAALLEVVVLADPGADPAAALPLVVVQADPGAARVNVASEQLSPCLDSANAGWGRRLSFFSYPE
jgi:hypothetical protein